MTREEKKEYDALKFTGEVITNPTEAIKAKCMECGCDYFGNVQLCTVTNCPLWPFREGKNPYRSKRTYSEEQKAAAKERMKVARKKKEN